MVRDKGIEPLASTWKEDVLAITPIPQIERAFTSLLLLYTIIDLFQEQ